MPDITQDILQIQKAVFGEEVRGSIVDALLATARESEEAISTNQQAQEQVLEARRIVDATEKIVNTEVQGFSPEVELVREQRGVSISVTDRSGTDTAMVYDGSDGVGVRSVVTKYCQTTSSTPPSQSSSSWSSSMPTALNPGQYLHTQICITLTNSSVSYFYLVARNGTDGAAGTGISSITVKYQQTSSSATPSGSSSGWSASIPSPVANYYMHTQVAITLTNGSTVYFYLKSKNGSNGAGGASGVTFTPSVSSNGVLSWTNNGGLTNPASVNIKGPQGPSPSVVNNLTSTSTTSALSAAQGKQLKTLIDAQDTKISNLPVGKYGYEHTNSNFVSIADFMNDINTLSKSVIPFKVKASASWAPASVGAWLKGIIFVQNAGLSSDFGTVLATTDSGAYHGHIYYSSSTAVWSIAWKAL